MSAMLTAAILTLSALVQEPVAYEISFPNAVHHEARIEVSFRDVPAGTLELRMSRASPGRYALHEFARNVYAVEVTDGAGRTLPVERPDPYGWNVSGHDGTVHVSYTLFGDRADGTYTGIDGTHAHLNMPATFMWARRLQGRPIQIRFRPPNGTRWRVATQLVPTEDSLRFTAPNLAYFMDSPAELSDFSLRRWQIEAADGTRYTIRLAVHHDGSEADVDVFADMVRAVVEEARRVYGDWPAFDYGTYTFIADYLPYVAGDAMEHRNSTMLTSTAPLEGNALALLGSVAHEFFHAWNVERIRPASLEPFDFERANMSGELWFGEGFTSYYDDLLIRRAGLIDDARFARDLGAVLDYVINSPGHRFFSPVGMSMRAPFVDAANWSGPLNLGNTFISYYSWGAALALALDLTLRTRFDRTLDEYMRLLWQRYGVGKRAYRLADLESALAELSGDSGFARRFFARHVRGQELPDFRALLARAGLLLRRADPGEAVLGAVELRYGKRGARVSGYTRIGTPLYRAGIDRGDTITRLDGRRITSAADLTDVLAAHRPGDVVEIEYAGRRDRRRARITLEESPALELVPYEAVGRGLSDGMRAVRRAWLESPPAPEPVGAGR